MQSSKNHSNNLTTKLSEVSEMQNNKSSEPRVQQQPSINEIIDLDDQQIPKQQSYSVEQLVPSFRTISDEQKEKDERDKQLMQQIIEENRRKQLLEEEETKKFLLRKQLKKKIKEISKSQEKPDPNDPAVIRQKRRKHLLHLSVNHMTRYKKNKILQMADCQVNTMRQSMKQQVFEFLIYGIYEIKQMDKSKLSAEELKVYNLDSVDIFNYAKNLLLQIDHALFKYLNHSNSLAINKQFKVRWKDLKHNIADYQNYELRKKILCNIWDAKTVACIDEEQLYSPQKRERQRVRRYRMLDQAQKQVKPETKVDEPVIEYCRIPQMKPAQKNVQKKTQNSQNTSRYYDQTILKFIQEHMDQRFPENLRKNLQLFGEDKKYETVKKQLLDHLHQIFKDYPKGLEQVNKIQQML